MKLPYFKFGSPTLCTYCGDIPSGKDHIFAVSSQASTRSKSDKVCYGPTTPACATCNSAILGNKGFDSFWDRCSYVALRLEKRAKPIEWSKDQIGELDYKLRMFVEKEQNKRQWWRWRADWFQSRDFVLNLESLISEPCLDPMSPKFSSELFRYFDSTIRFIKAVRPEW